MFMHFGAAPIRIPGTGRRGSLIAIQNDSTNYPSHSAALITSENGLRSRQAILSTIRAWLSVSDVSNAHAAHKDNYAPHDFRVLTYERLQLLMVLLQAVVMFESRSALVEELVSMQPHPGKYQRDFLLPDDVSEALSSQKAASDISA